MAPISVDFRFFLCYKLFIRKDEEEEILSRREFIKILILIHKLTGMEYDIAGG
jgi:hypothetical protein